MYCFNNFVLNWIWNFHSSKLLVLVTVFSHKLSLLFDLTPSSQICLIFRKLTILVDLSAHVIRRFSLFRSRTFLEEFGSLYCSILMVEWIATLGVFIGGALLAFQAITCGNQSCQGDKYCQSQGRFEIHDFWGKFYDFLGSSNGACSKQKSSRKKNSF